MTTTGSTWNDRESLEKLGERAEKLYYTLDRKELLKMPVTIIERCWQVRSRRNRRTKPPSRCCSTATEAGWKKQPAWKKQGS